MIANAVAGAPPYGLLRLFAGAKAAVWDTPSPVAARASVDVRGGGRPVVFLFATLLHPKS